MSHYSVLVAVDEDSDLDAIMAPYEESPDDRQYLEFEPADMEELQKDYKEHGEGRPFDQFVDEWAGYKLVGGVYGYWHNPQAKWDWWVVGGRWEDYLLLKNGREASRAAVSQIDFEATRQRQRSWALEGWDNYEALLAVIGITPAEYEQLDNSECQNAWKKIREAITSGEHGHLRDALSNNFGFEAYGTTREAHDQFAYNKAVTYAFIDLEGKWHSRGRMGWWGISTNEVDTYDAEFWAWIGSLPANQKLVILDLHI